MKTEWDYTDLADAYLKRPDYSDDAINSMLKITGTKKGEAVCDVGAGTAHLTLKLAAYGFKVTAVEPNDAMRANGIARTKDLSNVSWCEGTGENTGQAANSFRLVTFGSSFNVTDRNAALRETVRILQPEGWFACMWNHRDLSDPVQLAIESVIKDFVPDYEYGARREDQTEIINESGLFNSVQKVEGGIVHKQSREDCVQAWRSHGTLQRQVGDQFKDVVVAIENILVERGITELTIPYTTRVWIAQARAL